MQLRRPGSAGKYVTNSVPVSLLLRHFVVVVQVKKSIIIHIYTEIKSDRQDREKEK
jgi:hypothetical protein